MTTFGDSVYENGGMPVGLGGLIPPGGTVFYVDPANGAAGNDGLTPTSAMALVSQAYAKCTANKNDVVVLIGNATGNTEAAAITWSKNYTHLIGLAAPTQVAQRARIFQAAALTGASPFFTVSASGCIFRNIYSFQGVADNTSLINWSVTGGRNYFENVHFAGGGHATQAVDGGASLKLDGAEENTFVNCTIGVDTVAAGTGMAGILFDGEAHRNVFKGCNVTMYAGNAGAIFAEVADSTGIDRYTIFDGCMFLNTAAQAMTQAFAIPAGMGAPRRIFLKDCALLGATDWDGNDRGVIYANMGTITGGGNAGLFVVSAAI